METAAVTTALDKQGIELVYVNIMKETYNNNRSIIWLHKHSLVFKLHKNLRQGDTKTTEIFTAVSMGNF